MIVGGAVYKCNLRGGMALAFYDARARFFVSPSWVESGAIVYANEDGEWGFDEIRGNIPALRAVVEKVLLRASAICISRDAGPHRALTVSGSVHATEFSYEDCMLWEHRCDQLLSYIPQFHRRSSQSAKARHRGQARSRTARAKLIEASAGELEE